MSSQPPTTWRSIFCSSIHFSRAGMSLSGFDTGRVGLPPAKEKPRLPPSSISRIDGKCRCLRADRVEQAWRDEMGVAVDDHVACSCGLPCCASAMASPIAEMRMGSLLKEMPSGATQSLIALEIAAGAPR